MLIYESEDTSFLFCWLFHFLTLNLILGLVPLYVHSPPSRTTAMVKFWWGFDQISEDTTWQHLITFLLCIPLTSCSKASLMLHHGMFSGTCLALMHEQMGNVTELVLMGSPLTDGVWKCMENTIPSFSLSEQLWTHFILLRRSNRIKHPLSVSATNLITCPGIDFPFFPFNSPWSSFRFPGVS